MLSRLFRSALPFAAALTLAALAPAAHAQILDAFNQGAFDSGDVVLTTQDDVNDFNKTQYFNTQTILTGFNNGQQAAVRQFAFRLTNPEVGDSYNVLAVGVRDALGVSTGPGTTSTTTITYVGGDGSPLNLNVNAAPIFRVSVFASDMPFSTTVTLVSGTGGTYTSTLDIPQVPSSATATDFDYDFSNLVGTGELDNLRSVQFSSINQDSLDYLIDNFSFVAPTAVTAAPEPGSIALALMAGVPVLGVVRNRRKRTSDIGK